MDIFAGCYKSDQKGSEELADTHGGFVKQVRYRRIVYINLHTCRAYAVYQEGVCDTACNMRRHDPIDGANAIPIKYAA